jgi:hypothetical protein
MFAVLEDAIDCYLKNMTAKSRHRRILFYEVQNWMNARNRAGLFSYETLCEGLEIDPVALRAALERRLRQGAATGLRNRVFGEIKRKSQTKYLEVERNMSDLSASCFTYREAGRSNRGPYLDHF